MYGHPAARSTPPATECYRTLIPVSVKMHSSRPVRSAQRGTLAIMDRTEAQLHMLLTRDRLARRPQPAEHEHRPAESAAFRAGAPHHARRRGAVRAPQGGGAVEHGRARDPRRHGRSNRGAAENQSRCRFVHARRRRMGACPEDFSPKEALRSSPKSLRPPAGHKMERLPRDPDAGAVGVVGA